MLNHIANEVFQAALASDAAMNAALREMLHLVDDSHVRRLIEAQRDTRLALDRLLAHLHTLNAIPDSEIRTTKACRTCGVPKALVEFPVEVHARDGRRSDCKTCRAAYVLRRERERRAYKQKPPDCSGGLCASKAE